MEVRIKLERKHAIVIALSCTLLLGGLFANAFQSGLAPNVMGHDGTELTGITGSSITDGSITGSDVDESTLACTSIPGLSASLCDGSDAAGLSSMNSFSNSCGGANSCAVSCSSGTITGGSCDCNGGTVTSNGGAISGNTLTCYCAGPTTINTRVQCIS